MGILDSIGSYLGDEENRLNLASGFAGMSGNPNAGNIQQGYQNRLTALQDDRKLKAKTDLATTTASNQRNRTAEFLIGKGGEFAKIGNALAAQQISGSEAMAMHTALVGKKPTERRIVKGVDDFNYYTDDMTRVLPSATAPDPAKTAMKQNYEFLIEEGKTPEEALAMLKAGPTINMGEKGFLKGLGTGGSDIIKEKHSKAQSAVGTITTINNLRPLMEAGVYSGPLSENQVLVSRLGKKMGVTGADNQEVLNNTTAAMQQLASLELTAAQGMKGQGQITENERALIKRASGGDLMTMTSGEISGLLDGLDKLARQRIDEYGGFMESVSTMDGAAQFMPIYSVTAPAAYTPAGVTVKRVR